MADRHRTPSYPLRLPQDIRSELSAAAQRNGRTLNAEILSRVLNSLNPAESKRPPLGGLLMQSEDRAA